MKKPILFVLVIVVITSGCTDKSKNADVEFGEVLTNQGNHQIEFNVTGNLDRYELILFDPNGQEEVSKSLISNNSKKKSSKVILELDKWTEGEYTVILESQGETIVRKTDYINSSDLKSPSDQDIASNVKINEIKSIKWSDDYIIEDFSMTVDNNQDNPIGVDSVRVIIPASSDQDAGARVDDRTLEPGNNIVQPPQDWTTWNNEWNSLSGPYIAEFQILNEQEELISTETKTIDVP